MSTAFGAIAVLVVSIAVVSTTAYWRERELSTNLQESLANEAAEKSRAEMARRVAQSREVIARRNLYTADMTQVIQARERGDTVKALAFLENNRPQPGDLDFRTGAWYFAWDRLHSDSATVWAHAGRVQQEIAFSTDGTLLATAGEDGLVRLWKPRSQQAPVLTLHEPDTPTAVAMSSRRGVIASACLNGSVRLVDIATGRMLSTVHVSGGPVYALKFSPDQELLIVSARHQLRLFSVPQLREVGRIEECLPEIAVLAVADKAPFVAVGLQSGGIRVLELEDASADPANDDWIAADLGVALSRDGKFLAAGDGNGLTRVWEMDSGRSISEFLNEPSVIGLGFVRGPAGSTSLLVSSQNAVRLWNPESGKLLQTIPAAADEIVGFGVAPEGGFAIGTREGVVKVWLECPDASLRTLHRHVGEVWEVAVSPDGKRLASRRH